VGSNPTATAIYQQKRRIASVERSAFCCQGLSLGLSCPCLHALGRNAVPAAGVFVAVHHALRHVRSCCRIRLYVEIKAPPVAARTWRRSSPADRDRDTARGPGGPCSVTARSAGQHQRRVCRRKTMRGRRTLAGQKLRRAKPRVLAAPHPGRSSGWPDRNQRCGGLCLKMGCTKAGFVLP
jgi:hypothetical protein